MSGETEVVVATTTDSQSTADAAAQGDEEAARVPVEESSLRDFRQSESEDGAVSSVSFEHPQSERQTFIAQLEQDAADLPQLISDDPEPDHQADGDADLAEVRRIATQDAIAAGRRRMEQEPQPTQAWQQEERTLVAQAALGYQEQMAKIRQRDPERFDKANENLKRVIDAGAQLRDDVRDAIILSQAAEGFFALTDNPQELRAFIALPPDAQKVKIGQLQARAERQGARQTRSNAPPPIHPVKGSATRSSLPKDEMEYQDFRRVREAEIRARRGR
jgi:hypothetical protein